jgi:peptide/nickel transport system substrate-binding protein
VGIFLDLKGSKVPALSSVLVRQAMNYAINRNALATAFGGTPTDEIMTYEGYDPTYANYYSYNPAKAKALLAAAGYKNGVTISTVVSYGPLGSLGTPLVQAVASQLAAVGITLHVAPAPTLSAFVAAVNAGPPAYQGPYGVDFMPVYYGIFLGGDASGWTDPVINSLENQANGAAPASAPAYWKQITDRIVTQAYFLPTILANGYWYVDSQKVTNVQADSQYHLLSPTTWLPK